MFNLSKLQVRTATEADSFCFSDALDLLNRTQGVGLFKLDYIQSRLNSQNSIFVAAFYGNELVGAASTRVYDPKEGAEYMLFGDESRRFLEGGKCGWMETSSVREDLQGFGIGKALIEYRLAWLKKQNCARAVGVSWVSGLKHTSEHAFRATGFEQIDEVLGFYRASSVRLGFLCPVCGEPPCECAARLFAKEL